MGIELVILDFDGTLTDIDKEAIPAVEGWKKDIGNELRLSTPEIDKKWSVAQAKIKENPTNYGWLSDSRIVAPAYADPLVMARTISELLFDEAGVYMDRSERETILQNRFFKRNYDLMRIVFKDEVVGFLGRVCDKFNVCIVTNSETECVAKKVAQLPREYSNIPIHGDAKKYILDLKWEDVPESVDRQGYGRPLFLQRRKYAAILLSLMSNRGLKPDNVVIVGDVYELDLLLPEHLGMHIVLTPRDSTPAFEIEVARTSPLGYVTRSLMEVIAHLESCSD